MSGGTAEARDPLALLNAFEAAVYSRRFPQAYATASKLVGVLLGTGGDLDLSPPDYTGNHYASHAAFCERFVTAWGTLLLNDDSGQVSSQALSLLRSLRIVDALVQGTAEGTLDPFMVALNARVQGRHTTDTLTRLALMSVPGSRVDVDVFALHPHIPEIVTAKAIAAVGAFVGCLPKAHDARVAAVEFLNSGKPQLTDCTRVGLSSDLLAAWMQCSYIAHPDAHRVKVFLNQVIARVPLAEPPLAAPVAVNGKPVMIVPLDAFTSTHAMFRCYGAVMEKCGGHFHRVAVGRNKALDEKSLRVFDEFLDIDAGCMQGGMPDFAKLLQWIAARRPALVFYPSIGMRLLTMLLATKRLAPVQAMTYGHPATSFSPVIDAGFLEEQWIVDAQRYNEEIVALPRGTLRFTLPRDSDETPVARAPRLTADGSEPVRIAIPSMAQKWSGPFLEAIAKVAQRAGDRVEFVFFSGLNGFNYPAAANTVQRMLPSATVHPHLSYHAYRSALARCHLHAGTFPFGGTNSIIDSLMQGLPVLCVAPEDARGAQDNDFVERVGLPSWLVAADADAYVETMLRLIDDRALLQTLRDTVADSERVASILLREGQPEAFAEALHDLVLRKVGAVTTDVNAR